MSVIRRVALASLLACATISAQERPAPPTWDVTQPRGQTRDISFTTNEGTWMSSDLSSDGSFIVFDLLGHIYRMPSSGGEAVALTQNSGIAVNYHPRLSPDGKLIAFVSDRSGQTNLWVMNADGSNPHAVFKDPNVRVTQPAWSPDGEFIYVVRQALGQGGGGGGGGSGIWMYHKNGGEGVEVISSRAQQGAAWPSPSRDGRYLYFQINVSTALPGYSGRTDFIAGAVQVRRLDIKTGDISAISFGEQSQQVQTSSGGMAAPEISPDGKYLAFIRRIPDGTISYRGHKFGPRTALFLRDLDGGGDRLIMDPVEQDMVEGIKTLRVFPGYSWSRDGKSIVVAQGGKLHRLDVASGNAPAIAFSAPVHRVISQQANTQTHIADDSVRVKFVRWHSVSPDGKTLAFEALGRVWVQSLPNGKPRRATTESFAPYEYAPAWSPDGQSLAFVSWDDSIAGHLWKVRASGGESPVRLTTAPGEYANPAWSPDGNTIVVARGAGESRRGRGIVWNPWWDLVTVPAGGGAYTHVTRVVTSLDGSAGSAFNNVRNQIVTPSWGPDGRIFYPQLIQVTNGGLEATLYSIRPNGDDRRAHFTFPYADEITVSRDGKWVAFEESDNVYVMPLPLGGTGGPPVRIDRKKARVPATKVSTSGGLFPRWRDNTTLDFGSGPHAYSYSIATQKYDTATIALAAKRDLPSGTVAFTNARLVTLGTPKVVERGTLVVTKGRITCAGSCSVPSGAKTFDANGTTIIPGFIDVHSHNYREHRGIIPQHNYEGASFLAYGITTTLDPSMWSQNLFPTGEMVDAGLVVGPRVFSTGDPLYSGDGSRQEEFVNYADAEAGIGKLKSWGAVSLKQYLQPKRDQRQWVTDIARKLGLQVTAEGNDLPYTLSMIMDGNTGFEHPMSYLPLYHDFTTFLGKAQATYSPTFMVGGAGPWNEEYWYQSSETWKDPKMRRFMPWMQHIPQTRRRMLRPETDYSYPFLAMGLADMVAAGGFGSIGAHGQHNGQGSHWEVWMAASGMTNLQALEVASLHGARFIGKGEDLGSLEVGKLADFMVLNANPLENIRNTMNIRWVVKDGIVYDDETLDELWPRQRKYGPLYWVQADMLKSDDKPIR